VKQQMSRRVAIVIAIEEYSDGRIPKVRFAEADATAFAAALEIAAPVDKVVLLSAKATKTSINSKIRQHVKTLTDEDELFLFYAGHGFSKNGYNFITCPILMVVSPRAVLEVDQVKRVSSLKNNHNS
jgi:Caspase domain